MTDQQGATRIVEAFEQEGRMSKVTEFVGRLTEVEQVEVFTEILAYVDNETIAEALYSDMDKIDLEEILRYIKEKTG